MRRIFLHHFSLAFFLCGAVVFSACTKKVEVSSDPAVREKALLIEKGRALYQSVCITCHNPNPTQNGVLGPSVAGSSLELLEARVVNASYPPGYTPKRSTKSMAALPHLKNDLPALYAYLNNL